LAAVALLQRGISGNAIALKGLPPLLPPLLLNTSGVATIDGSRENVTQVVLDAATGAAEEEEERGKLG